MEKAILWMVALSMVALQSCRQIYSGQCGSGLTWTLDDGTLVIEGQGAMEDWGHHGTETPWFEYRGDIRVVVIKDGVTHIGDHAFPCQSMVSVTIPGSVTSIGERSFWICCSLTSITIPGSVTSIGDGAFDGCTSLSSITLPESVTSIGESAFSGCTSLSSITLPEGVVSIGESAFSYCSSLSSITFPESLVSIGEDAFSNCESLSSIILPKYLASIGDGAFSYCTSLITITIKASIPPDIDVSTFTEVNWSIPVYVPASSIDAYRNSWGWLFSNIRPM